MDNIDRKQQNANGKNAPPREGSAPDWACAYYRLGFTPIRIPSGHKGPIEKNWQDTHYPNEAEVEQTFAGSWNMGLKLGEPGLVCIDLDCPEAVMLAPFILPPTGMIGGRASAPDSHHFYKLSAAQISKKVQFVDPTVTRDENGRAMMVEVMVRGQVIVAPSIYGDGEACVWREFSEPAVIDADTLVAKTKLLALGALMVRRWTEGIRHSLVLGFSAILAQTGYSREDADELLAAICHITGDPDQALLSNDVRTTFDKQEAGETINSWYWFREAEIDNKVIASVKKWFGFEGDDRRKHTSPMAAYVKRMAASIEVFRTLDGEAYVTFPTGGGKETQALDSSRFRGWLRHHFFESHDMVIDTTTTNNIISLLEYNAKPTDKRVHLRVAEDEGGDIFIDIGNTERQAIRLSPDGWEVVTEHPALFREGSGTLPLPVPVRGGRIEDLRQFINVASDTDFLVVIAWMTWSMLPFGPYTILVLNGGQGTGKSFVTLVARSLIDPNSAIKRSEPRDLEALMVAAYNSRLIEYDNLSSIKGWLADALCRLATEGGFATRRFHTNLEEVTFSAKRPILLNSIVGIATQPDLLDRSVVLELPEFRGRRREEGEMLNAFNGAKGKLLGALLDLTCEALSLLPGVKLESLPRMAGFARWGVAVERAMGIRAGTFMQRYNQNREQATLHAIESSSVAQEIINFMAGRETPWTGKPGKLWELLSELLPDGTPRPIDWPRSPKGMADQLKRFGETLRAVGIEVTCSDRTEKNGHVYTISKTDGWDDDNTTRQTSSNLMEYDKKGKEAKKVYFDPKDALAVFDKRQAEKAAERAKATATHNDEASPKRARKSGARRKSSKKG